MCSNIVTFKQIIGDINCVYLAGLYFQSKEGLAQSFLSKQCFNLTKIAGHILACAYVLCCETCN